MFFMMPSPHTFAFQVRRQEIKVLSMNAVIKTLNLCLVFAVPPVIALVIFATYVFNQGPFDSVFSFTILSLFNTLRFPLVVLPKALRGTSGEGAFFSPVCVARSLLCDFTELLACPTM